MSRKDREKKPHDAEQAEAEMRNAGAETPEGACNATDAPHAEGEAQPFIHLTVYYSI